LSFVAKATELKKAEVIRIHACPLLKKFKGWWAGMACEEINKMFLNNFNNKK